MFIKQITRTKYGSLPHPVCVYQDPTRRDIRDALEETRYMKVTPGIRFIANLTDNIMYIWNSYTVLHQDVAEQLRLNYPLGKDYIVGSYELVKGTISELEIDIKANGLLTTVDNLATGQLDPFLGTIFDTKSIEFIKSENEKVRDIILRTGVWYLNDEE